MRLALLFVACSSLFACTTTVSTERRAPEGDGSLRLPDDAPEPPPSKDTTGETISASPDGAAFAEVVTVRMRDHAYGLWFCTGTLVAPDRVVTAAHCLDPDKFVSYEIVAANAPGTPRVAARDPRVFGGPFAEVENPDIGWLTLDGEVTLDAYAELTDVVADVDAAEHDVLATAVVRTDETPWAPFFVEDTMKVTSAVEYGYTHGFATPMFSKGGDSGAGLFLVENGAVTHKLIGVARQPEPDRGLDHFTRIDAAFLAWYGE